MPIVSEESTRTRGDQQARLMPQETTFRKAGGRVWKGKDLFSSLVFAPVVVFVLGVDARAYGLTMPIPARCRFYRNAMSASLMPKLLVAQVTFALAVLAAMFLAGPHTRWSLRCHAWHSPSLTKRLCICRLCAPASSLVRCSGAESQMLYCI